MALSRLFAITPARLVPLLLVTSLVCGISTTARADQPTPLAAAQRAAETSSPATAGLAALLARGARVEDVLVLEHTPRGSFIAELLVVHQGRALRYPVKLTRDTSGACARWHISWTPDANFTTAMLNLLASGELPKTSAEATPLWRDAQRLPALPLLITRQQIISPYGPIPLSELDRIDPASATAEVAAPPSLSRHTARWAREFLDEEPGAAAVDFIADRRISWQLLNRAVFGVSGQGFYRIHIVTQQDSDPAQLRHIEALAPIFGAIPGVKQPAPLVLAYVPRESADASGWRVSQGSALLRDPDTCSPELSFCVASLPAYHARLEALATSMRAKNPDGLVMATFATTAEVELGDAVAWLQWSALALGITPHRIFIGYIKR